MASQHLKMTLILVGGVKERPSNQTCIIAPMEFWKILYSFTVINVRDQLSYEDFRDILLQFLEGESNEETILQPQHRQIGFDTYAIISPYTLRKSNLQNRIFEKCEEKSALLYVSRPFGYKDK